MKRLLAITAAGLLLTGCGQASQGNTGESLDASPSAKCLDVKQGMLKGIADGASGVAIKPVKGAAVKSKDFDEVYMIAMEFSAPGGGNETGVWATDSLTGDGLTVSVDSFAKSFTTWPDAGKAFDITASSHGVEESVACLDANRS